MLYDMTATLDHTNDPHGAKSPTEERVEELAEHLHDTWPFVLNDDFKYEVAREAIEFLRSAALTAARQVAVKAVITTTISRGHALTEMPQCHAKKCWCGGGEEALNNLINMVLTRAADEVDRALILEYNADEALVEHQRRAWDEGYDHVMKHGTGRITRGMNPYLEVDDA